MVAQTPVNLHINSLLLRGVCLLLPYRFIKTPEPGSGVFSLYVQISDRVSVGGNESRARRNC